MFTSRRVLGSGIDCMRSDTETLINSGEHLGGWQALAFLDYLLHSSRQRPWVRSRPCSLSHTPRRRLRRPCRRLPPEHPAPERVRAALQPCRAHLRPPASRDAGARMLRPGSGSVSLRAAGAAGAQPCGRCQEEFAHSWGRISFWTPQSI